MPVTARVNFLSPSPLLKQIEAAGRPLLHRMADQYLGIVTQAMHASHAGRTYIKPDGRVHQASAPGDPPAVDYGELIGNLGYEIQERGNRSVAVIGVLGSVSASGGPRGGATPALYARYLEFGTRTMLPRPIWTAAWLTFLSQAGPTVSEFFRAGGSGERGGP